MILNNNKCEKISQNYFIVKQFHFIFVQQYNNKGNYFFESCIKKL